MRRTLNDLLTGFGVSDETGQLEARIYEFVREKIGDELSWLAEDWHTTHVTSSERLGAADYVQGFYNGLVAAAVQVKNPDV